MHGRYPDHLTSSQMSGKDNQSFPNHIFPSLISPGAIRFSCSTLGKVVQPGEASVGPIDFPKSY